jgi:hypothetical protein
MNCVVHTDVPAVAYCRTCGKPLCANCKHDVRGVIFCEECIAQRLGDTIPVTPVPPVAGPGGRVVVTNEGPSTALATLLGFIPGVGAMYNGQFMKALVHVIIFASIIWMTGRVDFFGIFIPFFIFYMVFDAYKTARARQTGEPLPDPFGMERVWGGDAGVSRSTVANAATPETLGATEPSGPAVEYRNAPVGAIILIAIGVLFLLDTMGVFQWRWFGRFWPVILIAMGVWTWMRRRPGAGL